MLKNLLLCAALLLSLPCAANGNAALDNVAGFMRAYNAHDIDDMLIRMTDDVKWLGVADHQLVVETSDKDALRMAMIAHFAAKPQARSKIRSSLALGDTVALVEQAFYMSNGQNLSQCAMSLYQLQQGLIASITYYPATPCEE